MRTLVAFLSIVISVSVSANEKKIKECIIYRLGDINHELKNYPNHRTQVLNSKLSQLESCLVEFQAQGLNWGSADYAEKVRTRIEKRRASIQLMTIVPHLEELFMQKPIPTEELLTGAASFFSVHRYLVADIKNSIYELDPKFYSRALGLNGNLTAYSEYIARLKAEEERKQREIEASKARLRVMKEQNYRNMESALRADPSMTVPGWFTMEQRRKSNVVENVISCSKDSAIRSATVIKDKKLVRIVTDLKNYEGTIRRLPQYRGEWPTYELTPSASEKDQGYKIYIYDRSPHKRSKPADLPADIKPSPPLSLMIYIVSVDKNIPHVLGEPMPTQTSFTYRSESCWLVDQENFYKVF